MKIVRTPPSLGVPPNRIHPITSIAGVSFDEAWEGLMDGDMDGIPIAFIGLIGFVL